MAVFARTKTSRDWTIDREAQGKSEFWMTPHYKFNLTSEQKEALAKAHPIVKKTRAALENAYMDEWGRLICRRENVLHVSASPLSLHRALLIMDAVVKGVLSRGYSLSVWERGFNPPACFKIGNELVELLIRDRAKTLKKNQRTYGQMGVPTGELFFSTGGTTLADDKNCKLENRINDCIEAIIDAGESKRLWSFEREKQQLIYEEARRERELAEQLEKERLATLKTLETHAANWAKSQQVYAFIQAYEDCAGTPDAKWIEWAKHHAQSLNPLCNGYPA